MFKLLIFALLCVYTWAGNGTSKRNPLYVVPKDENSGIMQFDDFNRVEVGEPYTLLDAEFRYSVDQQRYSTKSTFNGTAAYNLNTAQMQLKVTTDGDTVFFQTNEKFRYQAGKAGRVTMSLAPGDALTSCTKKWGYWDDNNGLYFKLTGQTLSVCQLTNTSGTAVESCVDQDNFFYSAQEFLTDFAINEDNATIFEISFQWLGSGTTRFYGVTDDGERVELYAFKNPMDRAVPYMRTAVLPITFYSKGSAGNTTETTMSIICASVISNGGSEPPAVQFSHGMPTTYTTTSATEVPIYALQMKNTFSGVDNAVTAVLTNIKASVLTAGVQVKAFLNSTIAGATWTDVNTDVSPMQYATSITSCTGGREVARINIQTDTGGGNAASGFGTQATNFTGLTKIFTKNFNTDSNTLCITADRLSGTDASVIVNVGWNEIR